MSNGSLQRSLCSVEPHATIGAQDIVQSRPDRYGFLRKRGQKERMLENLHLSRHINWRQRFVAIKDGCCYCYSDEVARAPQQAFSLQGYNRIFRTKSDRAAFVFTVEPAITELKVHVFAATTDSDRIAWMQTFRTAMATANDVSLSPPGSGDSDDDMYRELEKPLYEQATFNSATSGGYIEEESEEEEESDDSDYDRPDELMEALKQKTGTNRRNVPLPPVPQSSASHDDVAPPPPNRPRPKPPLPGDSADGGSTARRTQGPDIRNRAAVPLPGMASPQQNAPDVKSKPKSAAAAHPTPGPRPTPPKKAMPRRLSERDSLFDNSDREAAIEIIRDSHAPGTFLIRKSRQGDSKVLVVMTMEDVKEYKIFVENGQFSLDKKAFFTSVDELLNHYSSNPIPNRRQTLVRSFSSSSDSH